MAKKQVKIEDGKLSNYRPLQKNPNAHTAEGLGMLEDSMQSVGFFAPITVAADGETLDGAARLEKAFEQFGEDAIVVTHDGTKPIIMVREDIADSQDPQAKRIIYLANRVAEMDLAWDIEQIVADMADGMDFEGIFSKAWLEALEVGDYSDLDDQLEELAGLEAGNITIAVPEKHVEVVRGWLANGEKDTANGLGKGVMKRCGLL